MSNEEELAREGLDIAHYPGKWKVAQATVSRNADATEDGRRRLPFWERVRLLYLELGGEFTDGHRS